MTKREWTDEEKICFTHPYECGVEGHPQGIHHVPPITVERIRSYLRSARHDVRHTVFSLRGTANALDRKQRLVDELETLEEWWEAQS